MPSSTSYQFRLYVAGNLLNSALAQRNLRGLCQKHLAGRYEIEVVDVFHSPQRALHDGVRMTPTLIRLHPLPQQRIVGALLQHHETARAIGITSAAS